MDADEERIIHKCCAVRYADMDRWTPGYTNEFAYQGVSRSARPADAGQRSMGSWQILFYHLGILGVFLAVKSYPFVPASLWPIIRDLRFHSLIFLASGRFILLLLHQCSSVSIRGSPPIKTALASLTYATVFAIVCLIEAGNHHHAGAAVLYIGE